MTIFYTILSEADLTELYIMMYLDKISEVE